MTGTARRAALLAIAVLAGGSALLGTWGYRRLSGSLPLLSGELRLPGLASEVVVDRDENGVPTIEGRSRTDVARALGLLHAQEQFFQMDLMRRRAAGELAELLGEAALASDRHHRLHRMRDRSRRVVAGADALEVLVLTAYAEGVNAGLEALDSPPFEYLVLQSAPDAWKLEDSVLVVLSMFFQLNDEAGVEDSTEGLLEDVLPRELAAFLTPEGSEWDATLTGEVFETPPVPGPEVLDLRGASPQTGAAGALGAVPDPDRGSNNWAVAGSRTAHGGALLANDMHLGHGVPNIWYRVVMLYGPEPRRLAGVTLPGTPALVAGTNGHVAWGFTNSGGDWVDLVEIELDPSDPTRYLTPEGMLSFEIRRETIEVKGRDPVEMEVRETLWGPIVDQDHRGRPRASRWIAHHPGGVNLRLGLLEEANSVEEALGLAPTLGIPPQNFVCAGADGSIGWTIAGRIPRRIGFDGRLPASWASGERRWDGFLSPDEYPIVLNPPGGRIWTANARVVGGEALAKIGDGGYAFGARGRQIRDALLELEKASEEDLLAIQLDDRALLLERWRKLFLDLIRDREELQPLEAALTDGWTGRASIDSTGYRAVKELRRAVFEEVYGALTAGARAADPRFHLDALPPWEGPLYELVTRRPPHLVPPPHESWEEALLDVVAREASSWPEPLETRTWGGANTSSIRHPLSAALPFLSWALDAPARALPGDTDMPRVQGPSHGASERLVVSPGRESEAIFHMPGGQSGHPLSPYFLAGHEDWEEGRPTPLLPGPAVYRLTLQPR